MDVKERRPYCSLTKSRRDKERRYTNSSAENEECRVPTQKSYSSSETLKAFDHDSSRLLYGNRVKDLVHREADEYTRQGQNFTLRQLGVCEPAARRGLAFCAEMGLPHRGYSISAGSDADTENEGVMSPEHAMRLWGRGVKSGRSSCLSSRSNSALTLTDTEHENKSDSENVNSCASVLLKSDKPDKAMETNLELQVLCTASPFVVCEYSCLNFDGTVLQNDEFTGIQISETQEIHWLPEAG
ncbi:teneurin-3-like protein [Pitangus sulphuratus]|nr:teneurin-3-like protein [Pitangus sulphuratus]